MKRVLVDMSATLIHHGHIRILKEAKKVGYVIVALTTDDEIIKNKGYEPELDFASRKEVLEAISYVDEVIPSNWLIEESFLKVYNIDLLIHGQDNSNKISSSKALVLPRTPNISSSLMRKKAAQNFLKAKDNFDEH
jgi:cytidyltransferase-like protein